MLTCKKCGNSDAKTIVKSGKAGKKDEEKKQRYKCKACGCHFTEGDGRVKQETAIKRAFTVILYSLGSASMRFIAKLFAVSPATVLNWLRQEEAILENPEINTNIKEIEFDEMWHFIDSKKTKNGLSKPWIVVQSELLPGLQAVVMLQRFNAYTTK